MDTQDRIQAFTRSMIFIGEIGFVAAVCWLVWRLR